MKPFIVEIGSNQDHQKAEIIDYLSVLDTIDSVVETEYKARWLLSDIHDNKWIIRTGKTKKNSKKEYSQTGKLYSYTCTVNWERMLPDGSLLTDEVNKPFLYPLKKWIFFIIDDPINQDTMSGKNIQDFVAKLFTFISWLYLHKERFNPNKYGLSRVSHSDIKQFCHEVINGGTFGVLRFGYRLMDEIGIPIGNDDDPLDLDASIIKKAISFFKKNDLYKDNIQGKKVIDRVKLYKNRALSSTDAYGHSGTCFFRQFEPELLEQNSQVLLSINQKTDFPSHRTPLIKDIKRKTYTDFVPVMIITAFRRGFQYWEMFNSFLPNPETIKLGEISAYCSKISYPKKHTPLIPLKTSLLTINKSVDMVINHSDSIVQCYENLLTNLDENGLLDRDNYRDITKNKVMNAVLPMEIKNHFQIVSFSRLDNNYKKNKKLSKKKVLSFVCLLELLKASCFILIAGLKPIRIEEIVRLPYKCLFFKPNDGYWIVHSLMKGGTNGEIPDTAKPIPMITARAIQVLQKLNKITQKFVGQLSNHDADYLLYNLNTGSGNREGRILDTDYIIGTIEKFCDYYETSIDEFGRRWYLNIHEMRKAFLLTFFWSFKHSSLDACRFMAGHVKPEHVFSYIELNNSDIEMTEIEADYARQQIVYFHDQSSLLEMQNTEELYQLVCKHFNVKSYTSIQEDELIEYLKLGIKKGKFSIDSYSIGESNGVINQIKVAFRILN